MPCEEPVRLDVENERWRCALDQKARIRFDWNALVAAVDLGRLDTRWIEAAGVDQRLVGPRRCADQDIRHELPTTNWGRASATRRARLCAL